ncbi:hypothetical protein D1BOALGB6SA_9500 [Olavius sp. associated proteobacterium Delta 1]|nr:hypothetical protein D1BOALGB6SA_9500 [Olavius sp. associated proteobacterium Delta 1]
MLAAILALSSSILATGPAFTAIIAIVLLNEKITLQIGLGIITIIGGIVIFERDMNNEAGLGQRNSKDLIFPLLSALFYALSYGDAVKGFQSSQISLSRKVKIRLYISGTFQK